MKRVTFVLAMMVMAWLVPAVASADGITMDPVIGVRGLFADEFPSNDDTFRPMATGSGADACGADFEDMVGAIGGPVFCTNYVITQLYETIHSVTLRFADAAGGIPFGALSEDDSEFNGFGEFFPNVLEDGFSVFLTFDGGSQMLQCPNIIEGSHDCTTGDIIQVYLGVPTSEGNPNPPYLASLTQINSTDVDDSRSPIPAPVPEPGTLLLMGTGAAAMVRKLRRKVVA
jgi:hypothetical protein